MNPAQAFHANLDTPEQLIVFFAAAAFTAVALTVWSAITHTARTLTDWTLFGGAA